MSTLPYITAPGNIEKALEGIKSAATPGHVSQDFVKTILKIPGGSGNQVTSFLKKIGFANQDGTPSEIYKKFRNSDTSGIAAAEALRVGYSELYKRNEYMHELPDDKLKGLIIEETGQSKDSTVIQLTVASIKAIKKYASWKPVEKPVEENKAGNGGAIQVPPIPQNQFPPPKQETIGLNMSYTINLNLPATSDVAVFNAIFKSLKENLLKGSTHA
ncbi:MAG: DUF5343 domain-containing protein [Gemmatales bacterium]